MDRNEREAIPIAKIEKDQSWSLLGALFEKRILARLAREKEVLLPDENADALSDDIAAAFLRGRGRANVAAQLNVKPISRPRILQGLPDITARRTFADLIIRERAGDNGLFRIVDIKATRRALPFHKTQVAFYALLLEDLLRDLGVDASIDPLAEIWRIPDDGDAQGDRFHADKFALEPYKRLVRDFCERTLPGIADTTIHEGPNQALFHLYFKCEQCDYVDFCASQTASKRPPTSRDVSAVPGMTHESKRTLLQNGIRSVAALANAKPGIGRLDGAGWALSRRAQSLIVRAQSLAEDEVLEGSEPHTFLMPPKWDAGIFLLADEDPVDDGLVTIGYAYVRDGQTRREMIEILPTPSRHAEADALIRIFGQLIEDLREIDAHNASLERGGGGVHAHIFMYEPKEALNLQNAVKRHLQDPRVREGLLHMVRLFPPDDIIPEPELRGMQHLPATALRSVVEQLFALPVEASYDLRQVSQALLSKGLVETGYSPAPGFERRFSSLLSLAVSRGLRERRRGAHDANAVGLDVSARLSATRAIADWLKSEHTRRVDAGQGAMLRLKKKPFRLHATFDPLNAQDLELLRAFELLENRAGLLESLVRLAQRPESRRDAGRAIGPMKLLSVFERSYSSVDMLFAAPADAADADISAGAFGIILTDGSPDYVLEPRLWDSLKCRLKSARPNDAPHLRRISVGRAQFTSDLFKEVRRRAGEGNWWLDQIFTDVNSAKADAFLTHLASGAAQ